MEKRTKIIIGVSTLALVGVGIYILTRKGKGTSGVGSGSSLIWESPLSYMSHRDGGSYPIHLLKRPSAGTIVAGNTVVIEGNVPFAGRYKADSVWNDANGNVGAIYVTLKNYVPRGNTDRAYQEKAIIKVIR